MIYICVYLYITSKLHWKTSKVSRIGYIMSNTDDWCISSDLKLNEKVSFKIVNENGGD